MMENKDMSVLNSEIQTLSIAKSAEEPIKVASHLTEESKFENKKDFDSHVDNASTNSLEEATSEHDRLRAEHLHRLRSWINHRMTIEMTDGRVLIGTFLCTDRDANVILGSCGEYLSPQVFESKEDTGTQEARLLGLVMVPGQHIVNILHDQPHIS